MRRSLLAVVFATLSLLMPPGALAAPEAQEQRPVIAQPEQDATVRGVVQIIGTATHPQFQRFELYYARWPVPGDSAWIFIGPDAHFQQQPLGLLGTWDSRAVPDGQYALRVRVVKADGNYYDSDARRVTVANTKPSDTPTPKVSPTPTGTPTPVATLGPTPTIVVELPAVQRTATPKVTATRSSATATPRATPLVTSGGTGSTPAETESLISGERLKRSARTGAVYTLTAFAAIGAFFAFKGVLFWLWRRMRP